MNLQPRLYPGLDQNQALNSEASSLLIRALAGTGKTTTLAIKAADLIRTQGARNVLMLAYSEAGIKAIQARLDRLSTVRLEGLHLLTLEQFAPGYSKSRGTRSPCSPPAWKRTCSSSRRKKRCRKRPNGMPSSAYPN